MDSAPNVAIESVHDILRRRRHPLDVFFKPRTVAVIGASETTESVGRSILWNLISNPFGGTVFPVNPKRASILGIKSYPAIGAVPEEVDLAVIATPAPIVPEVVRECATAGVKGVIIISAGFKECGTAGVCLETEILAAARQSRMRVIGLNCLGLMSPLTGLNATFAGAMARPGSVGFSTFVSIGSMLDVGWGDLIDYLGDDPHTRSIVLYMESIGDPRTFISAARQVALSRANPFSIATTFRPPLIPIRLPAFSTPCGGTPTICAGCMKHQHWSLTADLGSGNAKLQPQSLRKCGVLAEQSSLNRKPRSCLGSTAYRSPKPTSRQMKVLRRRQRTHLVIRLS